MKRIYTGSKIYPLKIFGLESPLNGRIHVHAKNGWGCLLSLPYTQSAWLSDNSLFK